MNIIIIIIIIIPFRVFHTIVDGFQLESEWQQASLSLQNYSKYSGRPQQCCLLSGLYSSSYFQVLKCMYKSFSDYSKHAIYNCYHRHFYFP